MWTCELKRKVNACSIRGVVLCSKQSENSWQKEGRLSRSFREELCWQCSTKLWQLHERPGEKSCTKLRKLYEGSGKDWVVLTVQHEAAKVTWRIRKRVVLTLQHKAVKFMRKTWRRVTKIKLTWIYPTKVRKQLQS